MSKVKYRESLVISVTELKQNLGKYLDYAARQNDVVITKNGRKVARLTAYVTDLEQYFTMKEKALDYQYGGRKVSYGEFIEIAEKSTLRMEFINGEIYLLEPPSVRHQQLLARLYLVLDKYFRDTDCHVLFAPFEVHFFKKDSKEPDVMQPDVVVARDLKDNMTEKGRYMGTPTLIMEIVSPSTRTKDMIDKLNTYALSGVEQYWIVDPTQKKILLYSFKDSEIDKFGVYAGREVASSFVFPGLNLEAEPLFADLL